jgi:hypothetical protein
MSKHCSVQTDGSCSDETVQGKCFPHGTVQAVVPASSVRLIATNSQTTTTQYSYDSTSVLQCEVAFVRCSCALITVLELCRVPSGLGLLHAAAQRHGSCAVPHGSADFDRGGAPAARHCQKELAPGSGRFHHVPLPAGCRLHLPCECCTACTVLKN